MDEGGDGVWKDGGQMTVIKNFDIADKALTLIIEQGEGNMPGNAAASEPSEATANLLDECAADARDPSHFEIFEELRKKGKLDCYPLPRNPITTEFEKEHPEEYKVSRGLASLHRAPRVNAWIPIVHR